MTEEGVVADVRGGKIIVKIVRQPACGSCKACKTAESQEMEIELDNPIDAKVGQRVRLELDDSAILKGSLVTYGLPSLGLVTGLFLGRFMARLLNIGYELPSAALSIGLMVVSFLFINRYNNNTKEQYRPRVSQVIDNGG